MFIRGAQRIVPAAVVGVFRPYRVSRANAGSCCKVFAHGSGSAGFHHDRGLTLAQLAFCSVTSSLPSPTLHHRSKTFCPSCARAPSRARSKQSLARHQRTPPRQHLLFTAGQRAAVWRRRSLSAGTSLRVVRCPVDRRAVVADVRAIARFSSIVRRQARWPSEPLRVRFARARSGPHHVGPPAMCALHVADR